MKHLQRAAFELSVLNYLNILNHDFLYFCFKMEDGHCVKSVRIRSYSGLRFPAFGLNTERYGVSHRIQSE